MIFKKIRKGYADWRNFLCSTPARDYVFQKDAYEDQIGQESKCFPKSLRYGIFYLNGVVSSIYCILKLVRQCRTNS